MERAIADALEADTDRFIDILEERRRSSDVSHAFRTFNPQPYGGATPTSAGALKRMVLESQYLSYVIQEITDEKDEVRDVVLEEASVILDEMAQNLQLGSVRLLGFILSKVFKRVFGSIHVNEEGLTRLQQAIQENPVILMPNHRSYLDFLVLSYIMFTYDLSIPVIAAGIPLMGMKLIGEIFRRAGAFFIRRAIGSDKLYWAVLSEYVRTIVRTGYAPVEFYVEGLRSRTLKSLTPKLGMMHMVLEPVLKAEVFDISLIPISISYERVLEETLLAHELLGIPKPRETTGGLLKARTVLGEDYGCMRVCFGRPVSVREQLKGKINRMQYNLIPRDLPVKPSKETQEFVSHLAHTMIRLQERNMVLSPWNLMAVVLLQNLQGIDLDLLMHRTLWLKKLALHFQAHLNWPSVADSEVMSSSMALHHSVAHCKRGRVYLVEEAGPGPVSKEEGMFRRAAAVLMCASYRNQAVHVFTRPAMVAVAMATAASNRTDDLLHHFNFLLELFSNEFVFIPGQNVQDFEEGCFLLQRAGVIGRSDEEVYVTDEAALETIVFLRAILQPFIDSYQVVFRYLCEESSQTFREKNFLLSVRRFITKLLISGEIESHECLSSDVQKNVLSALLRMEAVTKTKVEDQSEFSVNTAAVRRIWNLLNGVLTPRISLDARL